MKTEMRIWSVRGAFCLEAPESDDDSLRAQMVNRMANVLSRLFENNGIDPASTVNLQFTQTRDIIEMNAAAAARAADSSLASVPLFCALEPQYPDSLPRTIRIMLTYYQSPDHSPSPVYAYGAEVLRKDLFDES